MTLRSLLLLLCVAIPTQASTEIAASVSRELLERNRALQTTDGAFLCDLLSSANSGGIRCNCINNQANCISKSIQCQGGSCYTFDATFGFSEDFVPQYTRVCVEFFTGDSPNSCVEFTLDEGEMLETCTVSFNGVECPSCTVCPGSTADTPLVNLNCSTVEPLASTNGCETIENSQALRLFGGGGSDAGVALSVSTVGLVVAGVYSMLLLLW